MAREQDDGRVVIIESHGGSGVGLFFLGAAIGAAAALWFAPRSGEETQRWVRTRLRDAREVAHDKVDELGEFVEDSVERVRENTRDAVEAGRGAVESAREELERRLDEARERRRTRRPVAVPDDEDEPVA